MHVPLSLGAALLIGGATAAAGVLASKALSKKPPAEAIPKPLPVAARNEAMEAADRTDTLRRRRGGAADIVAGPTGMEPTTATGKQTLGS